MVSAIQTQIPIIQNGDQALVQTQINTNKILRGISNQVFDNQDFVNQNTILGEIKLANLTLDQFQSIAGDDWILANGQECVNTSYSRLTGNNNVPTITFSGATAFIRVN